MSSENPIEAILSLLMYPPFSRRPDSALTKNAVQDLKASLHRQLLDRVSSNLPLKPERSNKRPSHVFPIAQIEKIEELQSLQAKRRKEAEKTRKIQAERTSLAIHMREEERSWQKSRRNFRVRSDFPP